MCKNSKPVVRQVHKLKKKVPSITQLKANLIDEFSDEIPNTLDFELGWCEGSSRKWLVVPEDLAQMYATCGGTEISLWCDVSPSKKRKRSESGLRKENDDEVDSIYEELLSQHSDNYTKPQLKLWARMIKCGTHDDYTNPPHVPLITGTTPKRHKPDLSESFRDAAVAVAKAFSPPPTTGTNTGSISSVSVCISPSKSDT